MYDIFAKSEILGYPDVFFTFTSTNDWDVNLSTALSQNGYNIWHSTNERKLLTTRTQDLLQEPTDQYYAHIRSSSTDNDKEYKCPFHENCQRKPIQAVLTEEEKKALLRKNFYNEQRIFEQRTRSLINNILCNENSNQRVTGIHTIKEFGNIPGLTHAHGVGWMAGREIRVIFSKLHTGEFILPSEVTKTTALVDTMITTEISSQGLVEQFPDIDTTRAEKIINLAKKVQTHSCSYKCSTGNTSDGCLHHFPRLPSVKTILCSTLDPGTDEKEAEELSSGAKEVKIALRKTLEGLRRNDLLEYSDLSDVLVHALGEIDEARALKENKIELKLVSFPNCKEVKDWFKYFVTNNVQHALLFAVYHTALSVATWKVDGNVVAQVISKRSVGAVYTVDYNPYCLEAMESSMSMSLITHTPEKVIEYITKARNFENSSLVTHLDKNVKSNNREQLIERAKSHRRVTLNEACYRVDNSLRLSETNIEVSFVNNKFPKQRVSTLTKVSFDGFEIPGRTGLFKRNRDILEKYAGRMRWV